ncbi:Uu.00g140400.m01.CDS01 [Anthostomella pinea]|uniref:Uu.00g140400.m01.CDS01 n=1 Tax=Anthostomella pinea TaxID=933095 RepID=A0AAI8VQW2_9PEZI|nr:Uu.00g140400.m01.CDS01 [Anthostomella pinea]
MPSKDLPSLLEKLGGDIAANVKTLSVALRDVEQPALSFAADSPVYVLPSNAPAAAHESRAAISEACTELFQLVSGPSELLPNFMANYQTIFAFQWLLHFEILPLIPPEGSISYTAVAEAAKVPESQLKSVARMVMTSKVLCETADKELAHSAASAMFLKIPNMLDWARFMCRASIPTAANMIQATERWPESAQKTETAYNIAFKHELPFFAHLSQDPTLNQQFSGYMKSVTGGEGTDLTHLVNGFPWGELADGCSVIDVGGSTGHGTFALASAYPGLRFEVQDLPEVTKNGLGLLEKHPESLATRVQFRSHDFFQPQPVEGASVYLLRMILHDWADADAIKILSNIVSSMSASSVILLMDTVLPDPGAVPAIQERALRVRDLTMRQVFNSKERTLDDWTSLLSLVDGRLYLSSVTQPPGSHMSLMTVSLRST